MPTITLTAWPIVALVLFKVLGPVRGVIWATLAGALLLPEAFKLDVPGLPPYNKDSAIALGLLFGMWSTRRMGGSAPQTRNGWDVWLLSALVVLFVLSPFLTVLNNREPLAYGPTIIPGLNLRDLITMISDSVVALIPFLAARHRLVSPESHRFLLEAFVAAGLAYSLLILFEARMSPQFHQWVYGYFQHSWAQHIRGDGFRPIVFLRHGLFVGIFLLTCIMAAFTLMQTEGKEMRTRVMLGIAGAWLIIVLFISRNFGATALALAFLPFLWLLQSQNQVRLAMVIVIAFMAYPALRQANLVPLQSIAELSGKISEERQDSFLYRIRHEDAHLARALLKPMTGWGIWGRWRIWDPETGEDTSTSDGRWMREMGERGWIGYFALFGTISLSILFLRRASGKRKIPAATAGVAMIVAGTLAYQIANNTIGPMTMLVAGALAGFVSHRPGIAAAPIPLPASEERGQPRYTRFPGAGAKAAKVQPRPQEPRGSERLARMPRP